MLPRFAAALAFCLIQAGRLFSASHEPPKLRLPDTVKPSHYALDLTLAPEADTFTGSIEIDIELARPTEWIWLHSSGLNIREATIQSGSKVLAVQAKAAGSDFLGLSLPSTLPAGRARLHIGFSGPYNVKGTGGLFKVREGGEWYVFTQFEPLDARQAFPCFDEPNYKVPWQVTLHVRREHHALANTPVAAQIDEPAGMKAVRFAESKPLPAYLVAFAAGPFDLVDAGKAGKKSTPIRIITPRGKAALAQLAAQMTGPLLEQLEKWFDIPYPYEKLDCIAIPVTFGFGAMENPGLITFSRNLLLNEPGRDSIQFERGYAAVAAHELAHMWFGNLVTLSWWDDTWLNEAFATWMGNKTVAEWKPEWQENLDAQSGRLWVMQEDSLVSARQIRQPIESSHDIANAFDGITYTKGGSVIAMFESWVGKEAFRKGVRNYLRQYSWRNATAGDFLDAIGSLGRQQVTKAFSTFLEQPGVPLVSMKLRCDGTPSLELTQKRSLPLGSEGSASQTWQIPVCVRYEQGGTGRRECVLLSSASMEWKLAGAKACPEWVAGNAGGMGYYRVHYETGLLKKLLSNRGQILAVEERMGLLGDVSAMMDTGEMPAGDALALAPEFAQSSERHILESTIQIAGSVQAQLPQELRGNYARFIRKVYGAKARQLGWNTKPGDDTETRLKRAALVPLVARSGEDPELIAQARILAEGWLRDRKGIDPDLVTSVLGTAAKFSDRALYGRFRAALASTEDRRQRSQILSGMGSFRAPEIVKENYALLLSPDFDMREGVSLLWSGMMNPETRRMPFEFVKANYDAIVAKAPTGTSFDFGATLPYAGRAFCDDQSGSELAAFFKGKVESFAGGPRNLAGVLESIRLCQARKSVQQASIAEFLRQY